MYKFGDISKRRMQGVNELLTECAIRALSKNTRNDMTIPYMGGLRTAQQQNEIFKNGYSKCDGYKIQSYHQSGKALDVSPVILQKAIAKKLNLNEPKLKKDVRAAFVEFAYNMFESWQEMAKEGKTGNYILSWGGLWRGEWDSPHWQIKD